LAWATPELMARLRRKHAGSSGADEEGEPAERQLRVKATVWKAEDAQEALKADGETYAFKKSFAIVDFEREEDAAIVLEYAKGPTRLKLLSNKDFSIVDVGKPALGSPSTKQGKVRPQVPVAIEEQPIFAKDFKVEAVNPVWFGLCMRGNHTGTGSHHATPSTRPGLGRRSLHARGKMPPADTTSSKALIRASSEDLSYRGDKEGGLDRKTSAIV